MPPLIWLRSYLPDPILGTDELSASLSSLVFLKGLMIHVDVVEGRRIESSRVLMVVASAWIRELVCGEVSTNETSMLIWSWLFEILLQEKHL